MALNATMAAMALISIHATQTANVLVTSASIRAPMASVCKLTLTLLFAATVGRARRTIALSASVRADIARKLNATSAAVTAEAAFKPTAASQAAKEANVSAHVTEWNADVMNVTMAFAPITNLRKVLAVMVV